MLLLALFGLVGHVLGFWKLPFIGKQLSDLEVDCIAAAIVSDARYPGDLDVEVRKGVADAVVAYSEKYGKGICDVYRHGLTLVPVGFVRPKVLGVVSYFRVPDYARKVETDEAGWLADLEIAKESRGKLKLMRSGATHYVRAPRKSDKVAQPPEAANLIETTLKPKGRARRGSEEVGKARFFE